MVKINGEAKKAHAISVGVGGWVATLTGLYAIAATVGMPLPTPAWSSDIEEVQDDVKDLEITVLLSNLRAIRHEKYIVEKDIRAYGTSPVPDFLLQMHDDLKLEESETLRKIADAERKRDGG